MKMSMRLKRKMVAAAVGVVVVLGAPGSASARIPCEGAGGAIGAEATKNTVRVFCADGSQETYRFAPIQG